MFDPLKLPPAALEDPTVMEWALSRWEAARTANADLARAIERTWFSEVTIDRWLRADDDDLVRNVLHKLPTELFAPHGPAIAERWAVWPPALAAAATPALARYAPAAALRLFTEFFEERPLNRQKTEAVLAALPELPAGDAVKLLSVAQAAWEGIPQEKAPSVSQIGAFLKASLALEGGGSEALTEALAAAETPTDVAAVLRDVNEVLLDGEGLLGLILEMRHDETGVRLAELAPFFRPQAPLAELGRFERPEDPWAHALALFEAAPGDTAAAMAKHLRTAGPRQDEEIDDLFVNFALTTVAKAWGVAELKADSLDLGQLVDLLSVDLDRLPHFDALVARLRDLPRPAVAEALIERLEREWVDRGGKHLVHAMGMLGWEEFIPALIRATGEELGGPLGDPARDALNRIGSAAQAALIERWEELDDYQRIYGGSAVADVGGPPAAELALRLFPTFFREELEPWCDLAKAAPDPRVLELVAPEVRRKQTLIDETYLLLCLVLGQEPPELAEVRERVTKERQRLQRLLETLLRGEMPDEPLWLPLRCPDCGDENQYQVEALIAGAGRSEYLIIGEFPCASCGEWPEFEVSASAQAVIAADLLGLPFEMSSEHPRSSRVRRLTMTLGGRNVSVTEGLPALRERAAKEPTNPAVWARLARVEHAVKRPRRALAAAERALELAPTAAEAGLVKAKILADQGRKKEAFELLLDFVPLGAPWRLFLGGRKAVAQFEKEFGERYHDLRKELGRSDAPELESSFLKRLGPTQSVGPSPRQKVGRNDPCPCGSGKKFKKCCGR